MHYHQLTPSVVSEKNWDTKEDQGKSSMRVLYVLQLAKGMYCDKVIHVKTVSL